VRVKFFAKAMNPGRHPADEWLDAHQRGAAMLAEIFMLRMEAQTRSNGSATTTTPSKPASDTRFVPFTLPPKR
jgi:hypothetical protein